MKSIKDQIPVLKRNWYAVKCKFHCEKKVMYHFLIDEIEVYVPLQKKYRQYASRKKISEVALIPSYIFVYIERSEYIQVLRHPYVYHFLNFSGHLTPIPQTEMDMMKRVVGEYDDITIMDRDYQMGDQVKIIGGELTGLCGVLTESCNHNLTIELASLGIGMMINVDPKNLEFIGSKKKVA